MAADSADFLTKVGDPGSATTLAAPGHLIGGTEITVVSTTNWETTTGVIFAMDTVTIVNGEEVRDTGSYTEWEGVVSGATTITSMVLRYGSDQNYSAGSTTRVYIPVASSRENRVIDGLLVQHKQTGAHANTITTDTINENTAAHGIIVDGLTIKDSKLATDNSVVTANLTDANVTMPKITNPYKARAYPSADQTGVPDATWTIVTLGSESYDPNSNFASSTYTAPVTGYYVVTGNIQIQGTAIIESGISFLKNGSTTITAVISVVGSSTSVSHSISDILALTAGDYLNLQGYANATGTVTFEGGSGTYTNMSVHLLSI